MKTKYDYAAANALIAGGMAVAEAGRKVGIPYPALYSWLRSRRKHTGAQAVKRRKRSVNVKHTTISVPNETTSLTAHAVTVVVIRGTTDGIQTILRGISL